MEATMVEGKPLYGMTEELYRAVVALVDDRVREIRVLRSDFDRLQSAVQALAEAQVRTEERLSELAEAQRRTEERLSKLVEAQRRTEERVNELAEAQRRTEERLSELAEAQRRTEERVNELAEAQRRTEERVNELAEAQRRTEERLERLEATVQALVEAQKRTEERVNELVEAQRRTEERLSELAEAQKRAEERLGRLEATVQALAEAQKRAEEQISELAGAQRRTEEQIRILVQEMGAARKRLDQGEVRLSMLYGWRLESLYRERAYAYFGSLLRRVRVIPLPDIEEEMEARLTQAEVRDLWSLDLLVSGRVREQPELPEVWLAVEVSAVVDQDDVERAARRARFLRRLGRPVVAVAAGEKVTAGGKKAAEARQVLLLQDGQPLYWEQALQAALSSGAGGE